MEATSAADSPKLYRYTFKAGMTCDGCKNAITKLLGTEACKFSASLFNLKTKFKYIPQLFVSRLK